MISCHFVFAQPTVTVAPFPANPPSPKTLTTGTGSLSDMSNHLSQLGRSGDYTGGLSVTLSGANPKSIECCDDDGKIKFKVSASNITADVTWQPRIRLAVWGSRSEYITSCPAAVNEWDRYIGHVHNHEKMHHNFTKSWATESRIKSYFDQITDWESKCYDQAEAAQKSKAEFQTWAVSKATEIANKIYADVIADDPTDMVDPPGQGVYVLDTSKDCN